MRTQVGVGRKGIALGTKQQLAGAGNAAAPQISVRTPCQPSAGDCEMQIEEDGELGGKLVRCAWICGGCGCGRA